MFSAKHLSVAALYMIWSSVTNICTVITDKRSFWCVQLSPRTRNNGLQLQPFTALFPGPPGRAGARRELLDFMVQVKINRGRHADHPAVRSSAHRHNPPFLQAGCSSCRPTNNVKALKATSAFWSPQRCYLHRLRTFLILM